MSHTPPYFPTNVFAVKALSDERLAHEYRSLLVNAKQVRQELSDRGWNVVLNLPENPSNVVCVRARVWKTINTTKEI
jgi:hypothetical protein